MAKRALPSFYGGGDGGGGPGGLSGGDVTTSGGGADNLVATLSSRAVEQLVLRLASELVSVTSLLPKDSHAEYAAYLADICAQKSVIIEQVTQLCAQSDTAVQLFCDNDK
jgi:hypothetical protein